MEHKKDPDLYNTELFNLHFQSLDDVSRYRDPQLQQVGENYSYLRNFIWLPMLLIYGPL